MNLALLSSFCLILRMASNSCMEGSPSSSSDYRVFQLQWLCHMHGGMDKRNKRGNYSLVWSNESSIEQRDKTRRSLIGVAQIWNINVWNPTSIKFVNSELSIIFKVYVDSCNRFATSGSLYLKTIGYTFRSFLSLLASATFSIRP